LQKEYSLASKTRLTLKKRNVSKKRDSLTDSSSKMLR